VASETRRRVLSLDIGSRRIGVAVSDELGLAAHGLETLSARPLEGAIEILRQLVRKYKIEELVVGLPVNMDGTNGAGVEAVRGISRRLEEALPVTIHFVDERMTSAQAEKVLLEGNVGRKRRKDVRDKLAAVLILQSFLDRRSLGGQDG
jgi:putative Holliday junction resolvase